MKVQTEYMGIQIFIDSGTKEPLYTYTLLKELVEKELASLPMYLNIYPDMLVQSKEYDPDAVVVKYNKEKNRFERYQNHKWEDITYQ